MLDVVNSGCSILAICGQERAAWTTPAFDDNVLQLLVKVCGCSREYIGPSVPKVFKPP